MKILILFHGSLPDPARPVPGVALRAHAHGRGLTARGHRVAYVTRRRDLPPSGRGPEGEALLGFGSTAELRALLQADPPDRLICVAPDILADLGRMPIPTLLDLYAPRLLEAQFEGPELAPEAARLLRACAAADGFLVTTDAQAAFMTGFLPLAGVDCRRISPSVVPLSTPEGIRRRRLSAPPTLVSGGVFWPWLSPGPALKATLDHLEAADLGALHLFGGAYPLSAEGQGFEDPTAALASPRLLRRGFLPYGEVLGAYAGAWGALDVLPPSPERRLALSFRQMDYLGAGLPLIVSAHAPIAPLIEASGAGWVVPYGAAGPDEDALKAALDALLGDKDEARTRGQAARALGRARFSVEGAAEVLEGALQALASSPPRPGPLSRMAAFEGLYRDAQREVRRLLSSEATLRADRTKKEAEVLALGAQVRELTHTVGTLTLALEESLHLKRGEVERLRQEDGEGRADRRALERELEIRAADIKKKRRELGRLKERLEAVKADLKVLEADNRRLTAALGEAETEGHRLRQEVEGLRASSLRAQGEGDLLKLHLKKKSEELVGLVEERDGLQERLERREGELSNGLREARALARERGRMLDQVGLERADLLSALGEIRAHRDELLATVGSQAADLSKKEGERGALEGELKAARADVEALKGALTRAEGALSARLGRQLRGLLGPRS